MLLKLATTSLALVLLAWTSSGWAQADGRSSAVPPPAWMVMGFEAALADPAPDMAAATVNRRNARYLASGVPAGARAGAVIDRILPLLGDSDPFTRFAAAEVLGRIAAGDRPGAVIDRLLPLLGDSDWSVRRATAEALGRIVAPGRAGAVVDRLLPLLDDPALAVREATAEALRSIAAPDRAGAVIDRLLPLLFEDYTPNLPNAVAWALGRLATADRAVALIDRLLPLLGEGRPNVRSGAAAALAAIAPGDRTVAVIDRLVPLLRDSEWEVSRHAAWALRRILPADQASTVFDRLLPLLGERDLEVRVSTARALGLISMPDRTGAVVDRLLPLLGDSDPFLRRAAAEALGRITPNDRAGEVTDRLLPLLGESDLFSRFTYVEALGRIVPADRAGAVIDRLLPLLGESDRLVRSAAAEVLGRIATPDRAAAVIDRLLPLLGDRDRNVRSAAADVLGRIATPDRAGAVTDRLLPLLGDPTARIGQSSADMQEESDMRRAAAEALGRIVPTDRARAVFDRLLPLLGYSEWDVRTAAAAALERIVPADRVGTLIDRLLPLLLDQETASDTRTAVTPLLGRIGPGGISTAILAAQLIHRRAAAETPAIRAAGHVVTGAGAKGDGADIILAWLGRPKPPVDTIAARPEAAHAVLALLLRNWDALATPPTLREEAEARIMDITYAACRGAAQAESAGPLVHVALRWLSLLPLQGPIQRCWQPEQLATLKALQTRLQQANSTHAPALGALVRAEEAAPAWKLATWVVLGWATFWAAFLFAFPWSRRVQAAFFWNSELRRMLSLWFVPLLLFVLPPLRRRLLAPFRDTLLAQARLEDLPRLGFFGQGRAQPERGPPAPIQDVLRDLRGTVVLRGDAGLGKSSALRWYAAQSRRPVAFLAARDCAEGVDVAIARRIHDVQEKGFVRSLVHSGALTVIVDGLNEVSAATREKISAFAAEMEKGHLLIGTQPIEWTPPATARTVDLLKLDRDEAKAFLLSRPVGADAESRVHGVAYAAEVEAFLRRNIEDAPSDEDREAAAIVLSNPFDLTLAADLLAQGLKPSATALISEAFRIADEGRPGEPGYRTLAAQPFPLVSFGKLSVDMRLADRNWFKPDEFPAELPCLIARRLVMQRAMQGATGIEQRVVFRHERVWDFFIVAAFESDLLLCAEHVGDSRFRGAYLRIAETWPIEDATRVGDLLVEFAAESGDHTTSDPFIKRLKLRRKSLSRGRAKSSPAAPAAKSGRS